MKMTRRHFNTLAGVSAAGLVVPGLAQAKAGKGMNSFAAPAPGKNIHPLLAKRDQKAILARIQNLMKRDGIGALIVVKTENVAYARATYPGSPMDPMFHREARQSPLFRRVGMPTYSST